MKVSTEIDNNFGYEKITQLVDNIPLNYNVQQYYQLKTGKARTHNRRKKNDSSIWKCGFALMRLRSLPDI
jgi:hypothetical protein